MKLTEEQKSEKSASSCGLQREEEVRKEPKRKKSQESMQWPCWEATNRSHSENGA